MSREFARASSQYLKVSSIPVSGEPIALFARFRCVDIDNWQEVVALVNSASGVNYIALECRGDISSPPDNVRLIVRNNAAYKVAMATVSYSQYIWHSVLGIVASDFDRRCLLDGGNKGINTDYLAWPYAMDCISIGCLARDPVTAYFDGRVAEVALWDLSDWPGATGSAKASNFEVIAPVLHAGYSPLFYGLGLAAYWRLMRDEDTDIVGGYNMTTYNTPGIAEHPRVIYSSGPVVGVKSSIKIPVLMQHYKKLRVA